MSATSNPEPSLERTPLYDLHVSLGARMVPFAGYEMPVQYPLGILKEHLHTRASAGLFDVSHMGQAFLVGPDHATTANALETLVPADIANLGPGQQRYTQLLNDDGGIIDDLMVTRSVSADDDGSLMLVVNASRKEVDYAHIAAQLPDDVRLQPAPERGLLALLRCQRPEKLLGRRRHRRRGRCQLCVNDGAAERRNHSKREQKSWRNKTGHTHLAGGW